MVITGLLKNVLCVLFTGFACMGRVKLSSTSWYGCAVELGIHLSLFVRKSYTYMCIYTNVHLMCEYILCILYIIYIIHICT